MRWTLTYTRPATYTTYLKGTQLAFITIPPTTLGALTRMCILNRAAATPAALPILRHGMPHLIASIQAALSCGHRSSVPKRARMTRSSSGCRAFIPPCFLTFSSSTVCKNSWIFWQNWRLVMIWILKSDRPCGVRRWNWLCITLASIMLCAWCSIFVNSHVVIRHSSPFHWINPKRSKQPAQQWMKWRKSKHEFQFTLETTTS